MQSLLIIALKFQTGYAPAHLMLLTVDGLFLIGLVIFAELQNADYQLRGVDLFE